MKINRLVDDIDGTVDSIETHSFALDGKQYEIDLSADNWDLLVQELQPFIKHGRPLTRSTAMKVGVKKSFQRVRTPEENEVIRTWARDNGFPKVGTRGRLPSKAINAYLDSHPDAK